MYKQLLDEIFHAYPMYHKVGSTAYKEGLENIEALLEIVGHPERKFKSIHIAGTNGKGSVAHLTSSYCQERGLKTGLFTSPHLVDFRERIRIDGTMIDESDVLRFFNAYKRQFDELEPSFFEMTTTLAFWYFAEQKVDIAVVEVGLGGRLDATNVLNPILSIITNISLEHTQLLGNTIAKIAFQKAGIIKQDVPVVIGEFHPESFPVFTDIALQRNAPLFLAEENYTIEGTLLDCNILDVQGVTLYEHVRMPLLGEYQRKNLKTFLQAVEIIEQLMPVDKDVTVEAIQKVVTHTDFMGRWQILCHQPLTICDVGHNLGGLTITMKQLDALNCRQLRVVYGMVADKDIDHILPLLPRKAKYYVCKAAIERALPAAELAEKMQALGLDCAIYTSVSQALSAAQGDAEPEDVIFIGGSCFVVGEALATL